MSSRITAWLWILSAAGLPAPLPASPLLLRADFEDSLLLSAGHGRPELKGAAATWIDGQHGRALRLGADTRVTCPAAGNIDKARGTVCLWVRSHWDWNDGKNHDFFREDLPFTTGANCLRLWQWSVGVLRFDTRDAGDHYITHRSQSMKAGEWHHIAAWWDRDTGSGLLLDGQLVSSKRYVFEPRPSQTLYVSGDCDVDDLRIYDRALSVTQVQRVMAGFTLDAVECLGMTAPAEVTAGEPFPVSFRFRAPQGIGPGYRLTVSVDGFSVGSAQVEATDNAAEQAPSVEASIPEYLQLGEGEHDLSATLAGALALNPERAHQSLLVHPPPPAPPHRWRVDDDGRLLRDGQVWKPKSPQQGLLLNGQFCRPDEEDRLRQWQAQGRLVDALPVHLVDEVDCAQTDHEFAANAPTQVAELLPGKLFRLTGELKDVTATSKRLGRQFTLLPGFGYRLRTQPRPTPHLVVVESIDDVERYLEVAIDVAQGSRVAPHLAATGMGRTELMNLHATYNGREYELSGRPYRRTFLVFPKSDAINVMITNSRHDIGLQSSAPAAVSHIWVYEVTAPLRRLRNPVTLPAQDQRRSIGLFDPEIGAMFDNYGFTNAGPEMRSSSLRQFLDYCDYLGFNRFELRPFRLNEKALFRTPLFQQDSDLDIFAELLPLARRRGMMVVPRVMYLHSYHRLFENDPENIQQTRTGERLAFGREGPLPDPLRPPVQEIVKNAFRAMLTATDEYRDIVPGVCFDTSIGGLYHGRPGKWLASDVGYSQWDVETFCRDTGRKLPPEVTDHAARYNWLRANCFGEWLDWRARRWHDFICGLRDLTRKHDPRLSFILNLRVMPREEWTKGAGLRDIYRYSLYDPRLFRHESGIRLCWFNRINAGRYFGRLWWKNWFFDAGQPALMRTPEPPGMEIYYNYWEVARHPWAFRVGPASPVGRAFFEPYAHALRTMNPKWMLVFNWFRGSYGHETELRQWVRGYRALPYQAPREFEGRIDIAPASEEVWVRWFGSRLCVLNDSSAPRRVTLRFPHAGHLSAVLDAARMASIPFRSEGGQVTLEVFTDAWELRTLILKPE